MAEVTKGASFTPLTAQDKTDLRTSLGLGTAAQSAATDFASAASMAVLLSPSLYRLPFINSGFTLPPAGALANTIGAGDAVINGVRILMPATAVTFPASSDTYVDLTQAGAYVLVSVANGATTGMTQTPNSLRIGKIVTGASAISSATTGAKDPVGNWMGNITPLQVTSLYWGSSTQGTINYPGGNGIQFGAGSEVYDNVNGHSATSNNDRIYAPYAGIFTFSGGVDFSTGSGALDYLNMWKNGANTGLGYQTSRSAAGSGGAHTMNYSTPAFPLAAGDYVQLVSTLTSGDQAIVRCWASLNRIG